MKHENCPCEYKEICDYLGGKCAKDILGKYLVNQPGYTPEDIKARLKKLEEFDKNNEWD